MATAERLAELTQIVTNLTRGRTDYIATNGSGGASQFDSMIHRALGAGDNEANGLMEGVADIPAAADAAALAGFYSIQRLVLAVLTPEDTPASTQNGKKKAKDMPASVTQ